MRVNYLYIFYISINILLTANLYSQYSFIENKGQWHENVLYKMELNNGALFLENHCITYVFYQEGDLDHSKAHHGWEDREDALTRSAHAYKVHYKNMNKNVKIITQDVCEDYCNYFIGKDESKWASNVKKYKKITYKNIYDSIDLVYYAHSTGLKYDFIIKPGAKINQISLEYEGVDKLEIDNLGNLQVGTSVRTITESPIFAYQISDKDTTTIKCKYNLSRNKLSFNTIDKYDPTKTLIIDPSLVFSTYTGSTGDNWGFTATWDYKDNVYSGGIVFAVGYPTNVGAYQVNFAGGSPPLPNNPNYYGNGCDVGIIKYNPNGTQRLFATYLGGTTGQEMPHSLVVTESNDLIIMGTTGSADFPTTTNAFQRNFAGGTNVLYDNVISFANGVDIFVSKISSNGSQLLGSTYVGGSGNDGLNFKMYYTHNNPSTGRNHVEMHGNDSLYNNYADGARGEIIVDSNNMIYVGTNTFSTNFPAGINPGYQTTTGGGQDGIVFKLNADLSQLLWSSYLGGNKDDAIFSLCLNNNEDVLVAGATVSHNFPTTTGAYNTAFNGGNTDAFVSKLNANGNHLLSSTYFGSTAFDNAYFVRTDKFNNIFICGQTKASGNTLIQNALYSVPNSGQFITKFNPNLSSIIWSTVFGTGNGRPNISITAFAVDICNRVYLTGWGREWVNAYYNAAGDYYTWASNFGTKGMQVTPDAIQSTTDGQDFYVLVLNENASAIEYASFFGELHYDACAYSGRDHVDGGTSRFDKKGHIIQSVCASCGGCQRFPIAPSNAWSSTNNASNCNNAVFKIRIIEHLAEANFDPVPVGCAPYTVNFNNTSQGSSFLWNFGDGSPQSNIRNPIHTYNNAGEYTVRLIVGDPLSCNYYDTITRTFVVVQNSSSTLPDLQICPGENVMIGPNYNYAQGTTFNWVGNSVSNPNVQNPVVSPTTTTEYLLLASNICVDSVKQKVIVYVPDFNLTVSNDTMICPGGTANLLAQTTGIVNSWEWSTNSNFTNNIATTQSVNVNPNENTTYYVRAKENTCNTYLIETVNVNIHRFNYNIQNTQTICENASTNITITNNNQSDNLTYSWQPISQIDNGATTNSPTVSPSNNTTYHVTITNQMGCTTTDQVEINIDFLTFNTPTISNNLCYGYCNGTATITANGIEPYSYQWDNNINNNSITNLCAGTYRVTVNDANGCTASTSVEITQPNKLENNFINIIHSQCDGIGYGTATANVSGGTSPYSYHWNHGNNQQTNTTCLVGNNYLTITDANNCRLLDTVRILPSSNLISQVSNIENILCYGYCNASISVTTSQGNPPYNYTWSNGIRDTSIIYNLCVGEYIATIVDSDNCVTHQYIQLTQPDSLIVRVNISEPIKCYGETGNLSSTTSGGTRPHNLTWSNGNTDENANNLYAGTYTLTVIDANNCIDSIKITLPQPAELVINTIIENMLCDDVCNGKILTNTQGGTEPYRYRWTNGFTSKDIENLCEGSYNLKLLDKNNCELLTRYDITNLHYIPELNVTASKEEIFAGEQILLMANTQSLGSYTWNHSDILSNYKLPNPTAKPIKPTLFEVVFKDIHGCKATDTIRINVKEVICGDTYIFVPNAFSPNGDGNNDYFKPYFPQALITEVYFAVYNRWGNIMYETNEINMKGWDGIYNNQQLASDVFVYYIKARCLNNEIYEHKGNVTILK